MSRVGKKPVEVPEGVTVSMEGSLMKVKGPKGELSLNIVNDVLVQLNKDSVVVRPAGKSKHMRQQWGLHRTLVFNLIEGVTKGFEKTLKLNGVGYRAQAQGKTINLQLGYSHDISFPVPEGIDVKTPDQTTIIISGINKQMVGETAAKIREFRKPEPYKGKGIKYEDEYIFRKEGKKK